MTLCGDQYALCLCSGQLSYARSIAHWNETDILVQKYIFKEQKLSDVCMSSTWSTLQMFTGVFPAIYMEKGCKNHRKTLYSSKGKIVYVVGKPCNIYRLQLENPMINYHLLRERSLWEPQLWVVSSIFQIVQILVQSHFELVSSVLVLEATEPVSELVTHTCLEDTFGPTSKPPNDIYLVLILVKKAFI